MMMFCFTAVSSIQVKWMLAVHCAQEWIVQSFGSEEMLHQHSSITWGGVSGGGRGHQTQMVKLLVILHSELVRVFIFDIYLDLLS